MAEAADANQKIAYPDARRGTDCVREYTNGKGDMVRIQEPYDWLEDPDADETKEWVGKQVSLFEEYIGDSKMEETVAEKMKKMMNFERYSGFYRKANRYFYKHNSGLQNHSIQYTMDSLDGEPRVLLDPNTFSEDGTVALGSTYLSKDANLMAYTISKGGSDWVEILLLDVSSGKVLDDHLDHCKFTSVAWLDSSEGFFYTRYADPEVDDKGTETKSAVNQMIYFHKIGSSQDKDVRIMEAKDLGNEEYMFGVEISDDGAYLIITVSESCAPKNMLHLVPLAGLNVDSPLESFTQEKIMKVVDTMEWSYDYYGNDGVKFIIMTNDNAPNKRICTMNVETGDMKDLIAESKNPMQQFRILNNTILCANYLKDVCSDLQFFNMDGTAYDGIKCSFQAADLTIGGSHENGDFFVTETSMVTPGAIYHMDITKEEKSFTKYKEAKVPGYDPSQVEAKQVFYKSKDGTSIPMFIMSKKNVEMNGDNPTLLYGYGGFNISITPYFSVSRILWLEEFNGVYCIANIRGGAEYGEEWHQGGILDRKQNVFDDFCCAGQYLIDNKYTSNEKLVIEGGSNGGLLVGACCNQRPDLFAVGLAHVGVMDMLRFNKFTIGHAWCSDYGNPDESENFDALYAYSPLHNIPKMKEGVQYPAFLGLTADHDDRVVPLHTMKFMAELQHKVGSNAWQTNPLLTRIEVKAGHGAGKSLEKSIIERAQIFAFVSRFLRK